MQLSNQQYAQVVGETMGYDFTPFIGPGVDLISKFIPGQNPSPPVVVQEKQDVPWVPIAIGGGVVVMMVMVLANEKVIMPNAQLVIKREALAQGYNLWIKSATGQTATLQRSQEGIKIVMPKSQVKQMSASILDSMNARPSENDLNVSMPWGDILVPVIFKKYWPFMLVTGMGFTALGMFIRRK